jgi:pSer/pThr/pTyr-binding forkhead associated (FHA) protein
MVPAPMSVFRRIFNRPYREARAAEGLGDYRRAAALYAEADLPEDAANALLFLAARSQSLDERLAAFEDALRWIPDGHPRRREVEAQIGLAILDDAQRRGAHTVEEKRRLEDAAARLERSGRPSDAATAYELLGRLDDLARCLENAGDVERLEALLDRVGADERRDRDVRALVQEYEMALGVGARLEARAALRRAARLIATDATVSDLLRRLEARMCRPFRAELSIDGRRVAFVGKLPIVLGRADADFAVRGASVSRRHAELDVVGGELTVKDLGSRNGTLVRGLPIGGSLSVRGPIEIGLGDDVTLMAEPSGERVLAIEVVTGLDRGLRLIGGAGTLSLAAHPFAIRFADGHATLEGADVALDGKRCAVAVVLLAGDRIECGPHRIEVIG